MQKDLDNNIWENKDIRIARQSSIKDSINLLDIAERLGLLKNIHNFEDLFAEFNGIRNQVFDMIYKDMSLHIGKTPKTETITRDDDTGYEHKTSWRDDPIPEKQVEIIEKIIDRENIDDLSLDWRENLSKGEASDIIKKYPYKK